MLQFLQPILAALIGAAMSLFALLHSVRLFPSAVVWRQVAMVTPELGVILLFFACVVLAASGVALVVSGVRATRLRVAQIRRVRWQAEPSPASRYDDSNEEEWR